MPSFARWMKREGALYLSFAPPLRTSTLDDSDDAAQEVYQFEYGDVKREHFARTRTQENAYWIGRQLVVGGEEIFAREVAAGLRTKNDLKEFKNGLGLPTNFPAWWIDRIMFRAKDLKKITKKPEALAEFTEYIYGSNEWPKSTKATPIEMKLALAEYYERAALKLRREVLGARGMHIYQLQLSGGTMPGSMPTPPPNPVEKTLEDAGAPASMTVGEAADHAHVSYGYLSRMVREGQIVAYRPGKSYMIRREALADFIQAKEAGKLDILTRDLAE